MLSIIYEQCNQTNLYKCLNLARIRKEDGCAINHNNIRNIARKLEKLGMVAVDKNGFSVANPEIAEHVAGLAVNEGCFKAMANAARSALPIPEEYHRMPFTSYRQGLRELRIHLYLREYEEAGQVLRTLHKKYQDEYHILPPFQLYFSPFDQRKLHNLPEDMQGTALRQILDHSFEQFVPADSTFMYLYREFTGSGRSRPAPLRLLIGIQLLLRGYMREARDVIAEANDSDAMALRASLDFLAGNDTASIFDEALDLRRREKRTRKKHLCFENILDIFHILALLKQEDPAALRRAQSVIKTVQTIRDHHFSAATSHLQHFVRFQQGDVAYGRDMVKYMAYVPPAPDNSLDELCRSLVVCWMDIAAAKKYVKHLSALMQKAEKCGYTWFQSEAARLLSRIDNSNRSAHRKRADDLRGPRWKTGLVDIVKQKPAWERSIDALINLGESRQNAEAKTEDAGKPTERMTWRITIQHGWSEIVPYAQKRTPKGSWSKGRKVALERLYGEISGFPYLTAHDREICACIKYSYSRNYYGYGKDDYEFDTDRAMAALIGHPHVYWEKKPDTRVELVRGDPQLAVEEKQDSLTLRMVPSIINQGGCCIILEGPNRVRVIPVSDEHRRIAEILGKNGLEIPAGSRDRVVKAIAAIAPMVTVQSDISACGGSAKKIKADPRIHVRLLPMGQGLRVELLVRPIPDSTAYYAPGKGGKTVIGEVDGTPVQATRNHNDERKRAHEIAEACPTLTRIDHAGNEWRIPDPEDCLELLCELQEMDKGEGKDTFVVEWPRGQNMKVGYHAPLDKFRVSVKAREDWFEISGELELSQSRVLDMRTLLELLDSSPGRFIALGKGEFAAISNEFRKRLEQLRSATEMHGKELRFHPLAAPAIEEATADAGSLKADKHWRKTVKRLQAARALAPTLPSTLQAELRDYQVDGYQWLARLAHWGVGACLADDMGLGKTLQGIALVLERAPGGPTLVVAPTSVCLNWKDEAAKFAPTLKVRMFGPGNRARMLKSLKPLDLVITSYSLLQSEAENLAKVRWRTIILDEAQAIKNYQTKRSQAAMTLQGGFKLITTGTPIENHLGELWNLFRFINPGLLGTREHFNERFAIPIERHDDHEARRALRHLIQPFVLRRLKSQVLQELPPRTEIILHVDMTPEEAALYEALRQKAVEQIENDDGPAARKYLRILAEITRLRQACCHGRLVMKAAPATSSKLEVFGRTLDELLANRHKALVFSQFVGHLQIIREYLDQRSVTYQYLDGSTPAKERKKRVDAFQAGEGDLFLISLKAGGQGLNLTAADYVIHMDPWWNPAVEDQASDRAHRIGQQRPVTIYRLVTRNTIEEKIVALHQRKRDLADSLLKGGDLSGSMSADDLLRLLKDASVNGGT